MTRSLLVTIVNYNTREQLRRCLTALHDAARGMTVSVIVVDNASSDGSAEMVSRDFPGVHLLAERRNLGFAGGNNAALAAASDQQSDVLVLNPDVELSRAALQRMVAALAELPAAAAVAPLLRGPDGNEHTHLYRRFPSRTQLALFWTVVAPLSRRLAPLRRRWFEHDLRGTAPIAVDQLPGAALLMRRSALDTLGPMDPDYFIWFEDVDWCYRARRRGFELYVLPDAEACHEGGASFASWSTAVRVHQFYQAFFRFLCKHRLEALQTFAWTLLVPDLLLKHVLLHAAGWLRPGAKRVTLLPTLRSIRQIRSAHALGQVIRLTEEGLQPPTDAGTATTAAESDEVDAIVVNWNGVKYLPACLRALKASSLQLRITVVDNASSDGSIEYVRAAHPDVRLLALSRNLGYAGGANAGLHATWGKYAMIMNPDVIVDSAHFETLRDRLDADHRIGAAQGKLYRASPDAFQNGRLDPDEIDTAGHIIRRSRMVLDRGQGGPDLGEFHHEASVFSACGAALFLRRQMLEDVATGGEYFASSFFAYKEDIDLCWRARLRGWDIRYVPHAVGHHVRSLPHDGSAWRSMSRAARRHSWKNHYLLMLRNEPLLEILRDLPSIIGWEAVRVGHLLLRDPANVVAYYDLARALPSAVRARRHILRRRRAASADMRQWFGTQPVPTVSRLLQETTAT